MQPDFRYLYQQQVGMQNMQNIYSPALNEALSGRPFFTNADLHKYVGQVANGPKREGGKTSSVTKFALRSEDQSPGNYVNTVDRDGGFSRNGTTVNDAVLLDTADAAAQAIARRNAANPGGWASKYSIVPVTVTTTDALYEVTTTPATAPKTVYRVRHMPTNTDVHQTPGPRSGFRWLPPLGGAPTDYETMDDALDAIDERNDHWAPANVGEFGIIPITIPGSPVKIERKLITPASVTRSL